MSNTAAGQAASHKYAVTELLLSLLTGPRRNKLKAAESLYSIFAELSPDTIGRLDCYVREWHRLYMYRHRCLNGFCLDSYLDDMMSDKERLGVLIAASFDPSGHIRQEAVERLAAFGEAVPYIALRTNDWVNNVRRSAVSALIRAMESATDNQLLRSLPMFHKLSRCGRGSFDETLALLQNEIAKRAGFIEKAMRSGYTNARRFCVTHLLTPDYIDTIFEIYSREREPFIRLLYADIMLEHTPDRAVNTLLQDKCPRIAVNTLNYLYERFPSEALAKAKTLIFARNGGLRSLAQFIVRNMEPNTDLRACYLDGLSRTGSDLVGSIFGLGEHGSAADCALLEPYLGSRQPAVVKAAMCALMALDSRKYSDVITEQLLSPMQGATKTAAQLLRKYHCCDYERILEIYRSSDSAITQRRCAALLLTAPKWQGLLYTLTIMDDEDEELRNICHCSISSWAANFNKSYTKPTAAQAAQIEALLKNARHLPEKVKKEILFLLHTDMR
ncbi:MAG: hypothetical protein E7559_06700 [Ruminococcaceae bacterium]|nr:hypothetical protein [Oscillospiraceae bacterium]